MYHFFTEPSLIQGNTVRIEGGDVNHMKNVLRMKPGEDVEVGDGQGAEYICGIDHFEDDAVVLNLLSVKQENAELSSRIYLFQGLPKSDKMELIIQKAVELGVYKVIPTVTRRAVVKLDEKKAVKKTERWNTIALSAAKQCGRSLVPEVTPVMTFEKALVYAGGLDVLLIPYELADGMAQTKELIAGIKPGQSIGVFIGPEGGFEEQEIAQAIQKDASPVTLGKRILRTETAGLTMLSVLMFQLEK